MSAPRNLLVLAAAVALAASTAAHAGAALPPHVFTRLARSYEAARAALASDSMAGVKVPARAMAKEAAALAGHRATDTAGEAACERLMRDIAAAARELAAASDLEGARTAFAALSEPMIAYRNMVPGDRPEVVYCPMAKRSWLQPAGVISNPYLGKEMLRCGEVVSEPRRPASR